MLASLHIENIAVIKCVDVDLSEGFTVLTGETGAGKSILIDSVNLLLGGKLTKEVIRAGESRAYVSGMFCNLCEEAVRALDEMGFAIDAALSIEVADSEIVKRMSGRRVCEKCGASYHTEYKKPAVEGACNFCDGKLVIRKDDEPETVKNRLNVYHEQTEPLKDYYRNCGKLICVEGQEEVKDTTALVLSALESNV